MNRGHLLFVIIFALLLNTVVSGRRGVVFASDDGSHPAAYSAPQIRSLLLKVNDDIKQFHIVYEAPIRVGDSRGVFLRREIAVSSSGDFLYSSAKGNHLCTPEEDVLGERIVVHGNLGISESPAKRVFQRWSASEADPLSIARGDVLIVVLGWWPIALREPLGSTREPATWSEITASGRYVVRPELDHLRGAWCHIFEYPGHDRIWLDLSAGCKIVAREILDPGSKRVVQRVDVLEYVEADPGVWVPKKFTNRRIAEDDRGPGVDATIDVTTIEVNGGMSSKWFGFIPKPGAVELIDDRYEQRVDGGIDYLEELAVRIGRVRAAKMKQQASLGLPRIVSVNIVSSVAVLLIVLVSHMMRGKT